MQGSMSNSVVLAAALAAGLALGFAASTMAYRFKVLNVPGQNLVERMNRELGLDPSQREQIAEVMEDTRTEVANMRRELRHERRRLMIAAYLKVRAILNPDQQKKFDDEFVPPKFRAEAHQSERPPGIPQIGASPIPSPSP